MQEVKVSICIPAYENKEGISRLLISLCRQSYTDFEVIITDDSVTNGVKETVEEFVTWKEARENKASAGGAPTQETKTNVGGEKSQETKTNVGGAPTQETKVNAGGDPSQEMYEAKEFKSANIIKDKITYVHNTTPLGPGGNWNKSISLAKGEYIKIMHQDDWFTYEDSLEKFVKMLDENPKADLAFSGSRQVPETTLGEYSRCISDEDARLLKEDWRYLYINQCIGAPSATIFRRSEFEFEPELKWLIDSEFYMKVLRKNATMDYTGEDIVSIGISDSQLTEAVSKDREINMKEYTFVLEEFNLYEKKECRAKYISQALKFNVPYSKLKDHHVPRNEYFAAKRAYMRHLTGEYLKIIRNKLIK